MEATETGWRVFVAVVDDSDDSLAILDDDACWFRLELGVAQAPLNEDKIYFETKEQL